MSADIVPQGPEQEVGEEPPDLEALEGPGVEDEAVGVPSGHRSANRKTRSIDVFHTSAE